MFLVQIFINSIVRAGQIGLLAVGVTMILSILKFANFAHGEIALLGAYLTLFFTVTFNFNIVFSAILGIALTGIVGILSHKLIFKRISKEGGLSLLIAALGLSFILKNIIRAIWGSSPLGYPVSLPKIYNFLGTRITSTQLLVIVITVISMFLFHIILRKSKIGKAIRGTSNNLLLAEACGINVEKIIIYVWYISAAFAALGGILISLETVLWPEMGEQLLLTVFAAAILGGIGNIYGAILGALVIGFAENILLSVNWTLVLNFGGVLNLNLPEKIYFSTGYKYAISFAILIIILILRPRGILKGETGD
jgi:branched-subunit amino acid ABC-type transport system permease component